MKTGWHGVPAQLLDHMSVVHPLQLPWNLLQQQQQQPSNATRGYIDEGLLFHWLDPGNLYHVLMENGNYIYATACRLLKACSHEESHYQIFAMDPRVRLLLALRMADCLNLLLTATGQSVVAIVMAV